MARGEARWAELHILIKGTHCALLYLAPREELTLLDRPIVHIGTMGILTALFSCRYRQLTLSSHFHLTETIFTRKPQQTKMSSRSAWCTVFEIFCTVGEPGRRRLCVRCGQQCRHARESSRRRRLAWNGLALLRSAGVNIESHPPTCSLIQHTLANSLTD
ncbi:hypothetical protein GQ42DRAFT_22924 [Ramicandelaber brevisporus]|nr:hypothetical protein GQ42DRAFT_22924 [Ramicandelaber brevisporus]